MTGSEINEAPPSDEPRSDRHSAAVRVVIVVAYSMFVVYLGTRHPQELPSNQLFGHDKILHALAFGGLGVVAYRCGRSLWPERRPSHVVVAAVLFSTIIGAILEGLQASLPYRSMEFGDLVADFLGAVVAVWLAERFAWERLLPKL